jgi:SNF2 family DNA or RNA helicase
MEFKTKPFDHQLEEFEQHRDDPVRALFWEQGTGKSKALIDAAAHQHLEGNVDALLILAPNGVHENWATDELPAHMSPEVKWCVHLWKSKSAGTKWHQAALKELLHFPGLAVLCMSYDSFMTPRGKKYMKKFREKRRIFGAADESQRIKTPSAKRTISAVALGRWLKYKRILSGTPITSKPFDVWPQVRFLDNRFWEANGFASYEAFKTYFGVWEERVNSATEERFKTCTEFRNFEKLRDIVATISGRVLKDDVLDLPPKVYTKRYFDLTPEQWRIYRELKKEFFAYLESGELVTAPLIITRMLRFQQIASGFLPSDDGDSLTEFDNPRLQLLRETLEDVEGAALIFARFRYDVDQICKLLKGEHVRYDGAVSLEERSINRKAFQHPSGPRFFVGNPAVAGIGLTLTRASTIIYYSNSFNLEHRLQSEDRAHRIGQENTVRIIDLLGSGTIDLPLVHSLKSKWDMASQITGDIARKWL